MTTNIAAADGVVNGIPGTIVRVRNNSRQLRLSLAGQRDPDTDEARVGTPGDARAVAAAQDRADENRAGREPPDFSRDDEAEDRDRIHRRLRVTNT